MPSAVLAANTAANVTVADFLFIVSSCDVTIFAGLAAVDRARHRDMHVPNRLRPVE